MAFLDNSGDIILDAVLTDAGRKRLAQGDGTFRVVKFALSDDEIDYGLFNKSHPSGSAYYDLEIMQTPVLEAFTNNTSSLKHKLVSMTQTNLLYLPVMKLHSNCPGYTATQQSSFLNDGTFNNLIPVPLADVGGTGMFILAADAATRSELDEGFNVNGGVGVNAGEYLGENKAIKVVQGLDTDDISFRRPIASNLVETQYIIQSDYRMLRLTDPDNVRQEKSESYIDDDMIASYYLSRNIDSGMIGTTTPDERAGGANSDTLRNQDKIIKGPLGTHCKFNFIASAEIETSFALFDEFGGTDVTNSGNTYAYIDTNVRATGATTGSSIDIPIRIMKLKP